MSLTWWFLYNKHESRNHTWTKIPSIKEVYNMIYRKNVRAFIIGWIVYTNLDDRVASREYWRRNLVKGLQKCFHQSLMILLPRPHISFIMACNDHITQGFSMLYFYETMRVVAKIRVGGTIGVTDQGGRLPSNRKTTIWTLSHGKQCHNWKGQHFVHLEKKIN